MDLTGLILQGIQNCLDPIVLLTLFATTLLGIIIGALPGFGAATGLVIILPFTYSVDPSIALVALVGVYMGAEYGGSISSILINTPGTGGAVVTCFDGHPLAQQGKAREALLVSNIASFTGGIIGGLMMLLFLPLLAEIAFMFGGGEIFLLGVLGLTLVGSLSSGSILKGIASVAIGLLLAMVGTDAISGVARFYFGQRFLVSELPMIPVMLGLFSVPYLLSSAVEKAKNSKQIEFGNVTIKDNLRIFKDTFKLLYGKMKVLLLRSSLIGTLVGIIPGVGGSVATFLSYTMAKNSSKEPDKFGKGSYEGLAAPESTNNGIVGGSLIPVLSLGIPGSPAAAVFMSAIFMQGLIPGPKFMDAQGPLVYTVVIAVLLAATAQLFYGAFGIGFLSNILKISTHYLVPSVLIICAIGAYAVRGLGFDIGLFIIFGFIGFILMKCGFLLAGVILGFILGSIIEVNLLEAIAISSAKNGLLAYFLARPLCIGIFIVLVLFVIYTVRNMQKERKRKLCSDEIIRIEGWKGMRLYDLIAGIAGLAGCAFLYFSEVVSFPGLVGLFPSLSLLIIAVCCILLIARSVKNNVYTQKDLAPFGAVERNKFIAFSLLVIGYILGVLYVGFFASSFVFALAGTVYLHHKTGVEWTKKQKISHVVYAVVFTLAVYVVFDMVFALALPAKILF